MNTIKTQSSYCMADGLLSKSKYSDGQNVLCSHQVWNIYHVTIPHGPNIDISHLRLLTSWTFFSSAYKKIRKLKQLFD